MEITHHTLIFLFGLLGNITSFTVYLAPVPTFYRVYKKKSTEDFHSLPYLASLFSSMLWIYYAMQQTSAFLLITINSFGCLVETIYIATYITYAPRRARILTLKLLVLMNFGGLCAITSVSHFLIKEQTTRTKAIGWVSVAFSASVFASPLSVMRMVIRTKSVEFMPFYLSFFLTLSAVCWLLYGVMLKDLYISLPNVLGFIFGAIQMVLYVIYMGNTHNVKEQKLEEHIIDVEKISGIVMKSEELVPNSDKNVDTNVPEKKDSDEKKSNEEAVAAV